MSSIIENLLEQLMPFVTEKHEKIKLNKSPIIHYTNAEAAFLIVRDEKIWLRQPYFMNDYSELEHGWSLLISSLPRFQECFESVFKGTQLSVQESFTEEIQRVYRNVYIGCFSEYDTSKEEHGRLSMWRAYGGKSGIGLAFKYDDIFDENDNLIDDLYFLPVNYLTEKEFHQHVEKILTSFTLNHESLSAQGELIALELLKTSLKFLILTTKHPAFSEEQEWRLIYIPDEKQDVLQHKFEVINGIPQEIYVLDFNNLPSGSSLRKLSTMLEKVLVGPTQYPFALSKTFSEVLKNKNNLTDGLIHVTQIPLRS